MNNDPHRYDDMLDMPHHEPKNHPRMSRQNRAAQFSPFAALSGYEDAIAETARLTERRVEPDEGEKEVLDRKLQYLREHLEERPEAAFTVFVPDLRKDGGSYETVRGTIKKIVPSARQIVLYAENHISDGRVLDIDRIVDITDTSETE